MVDAGGFLGAFDEGPGDASEGGAIIQQDRHGIGGFAHGFGSGFVAHALAVKEVGEGLGLRGAVAVGHEGDAGGFVEAGGVTVHVLGGPGFEVVFEEGADGRFVLVRGLLLGAGGGACEEEEAGQQQQRGTVHAGGGNTAGGGDVKRSSLLRCRGGR